MDKLSGYGRRARKAVADGRDNQGLTKALREVNGPGPGRPLTGFNRALPVLPNGHHGMEQVDVKALLPGSGAAAALQYLLSGGLVQA